LPLHPDSRAAFERLHASGIRIVTLTNGSAENAATLFRNVGLDGFVERKLSVDDVRHWKPHRDVYLHAARVTGVQPSQVALIAAHPWDIAGARRAGLTTGFVARRGAHYPSVMDPPDVQGATLGEVADRLLSLHAA
ncbi:MAG TPA: HAD-IA family hydrolase, partial [Polyangiaceae bacterium]|nr:HAD-IA family hydrolase [Polyangiaceae bacterium]